MTPIVAEESQSVRIAAAQFAPGEDKAENLRIISDLVAEAARSGVQLIVFPEYSSFCQTPLSEAGIEAAEELDGEFVARLTTYCRLFNMVIVAGMLEKFDGNKVYNTLVAVGAEGLITYSRKLHLYDAFGAKESNRVEPGDPSVRGAFEVAGIRFGLMTCYDLRFPEVARWLLDFEIGVYLVPAQWMPGENKVHHWHSLLTARAIENIAYFVGADQDGPKSSGNTEIIDPLGISEGVLESGQGLVISEVSASVIEKARRQNPALDLRRFRVEPI